MSRCIVAVVAAAVIVSCREPTSERADGRATSSAAGSTRTSVPSEATQPTGTVPFVERTFDEGFRDVDAAALPARLRERPERVLLVNVWSTWCEPCVEEMPMLVRVARSLRDRGVGLVLVAADAPANRVAALEFLRRVGAASPGWFKVGSDDAFVRALHPDWSGALPFTVLLDRDRRALVSWPQPVVEPVLRAAIEAALAPSTGGPR